MESVTILTREQIGKLAEVLEKFPDVPQFEIMENNSSGIGPAMFVKFDQGKLPILIDITDVSNW